MAYLKQSRLELRGFDRYLRIMERDTEKKDSEGPLESFVELTAPIALSFRLFLATKTRVEAIQKKNQLELNRKGHLEKLLAVNQVT